MPLALCRETCPTAVAPHERLPSQKAAQRHTENSLRINEMLYLAIAHTRW
ncbi:hypothetical protein [Nostoc sp.]